MARAIKVFGERNSGTNYLQELLSLNTTIPQLRGIEPSALVRRIGYYPREALIDAFFGLTRRQNLGWKHASAPALDQLQRWRTDGVMFVSVTKNPYAWILSIYKRPHHRPGQLPDLLTFINSPWRTVRRDNLTTRTLPSPVSLWNLKNGSYQQLPGNTALRYEDLLSDPERELRRLEIPFQGHFRNVERSTKEVTKDFDWYKRYYLDERWREKLKPEHIAAINRHLNADVVSSFGYSILEPARAA